MSICPINPITPIGPLTCGTDGTPPFYSDLLQWLKAPAVDGILYDKIGKWSGEEVVNSYFNADGTNNITTNEINIGTTYTIKFNLLLTTQGYIIGSNNPSFLQFTSLTNLQMRDSGGAIVNFTVTDVGNWHTYRLERVGDDVDLYVDNVFSSSATLVGGSDFIYTRILRDVVSLVGLLNYINIADTLFDFTSGNQDNIVEGVNLTTGERVYGTIHNATGDDRKESKLIGQSVMSQVGYTVADGVNHYYDEALTQLVPQGKLSTTVSGLSGFWIETPVEPGAPFLVTQSLADITIIPDKFNTGLSDDTILTTVTGVGTWDGLYFKSSGANLTIDFVYANGDITDEITVSNLDLSGFKIITTNGDALSSARQVNFVNCKFDNLVTQYSSTLVTLTFERCSFASASGNDMIFNRCSFSGTTRDGMKPNANVTVNDCYFYDLAHYTTKYDHTDGIQIQGHPTRAGDIVFNNCRWEVPNLKISGSNASLNAAIMLQIEDSDIDNVQFNNCKVNGAGYTVYAWDKDGTHVLTNISFTNIQFGTAKQYGDWYPTIDSAVSITNAVATDGLYVGEVWKDGGNIHLSVTNDTNTARDLVVVTNLGTTTFSIPACLDYVDFVEDVTVFDSFPFDLEKTVADADWVICYEGTDMQDNNHIRFVNWSGSDVYR